MKFLFLLISTGLISGCATTAKYESKLNALVGTSENDLIVNWGVPDNTYTLNNGNKLLQYLRNDGTVAYPIGKNYYTETYWCKTTFTVNGSGIVLDWKHEGNKCESK